VTVLDCLGQPCPVPIIKLAKVFAGLEVGETIIVLADDPAAGPDLRAWCRMRDQTYAGSDGAAHRITRRS
jgi:tRNA 2-thiouridine synthesizing protein A